MDTTGETIKQGVIGKVKWFNNKAGYGFITVSEKGDYNGKDIFTHFTAIKVTNSQYKYLVQGEPFRLQQNCPRNSASLSI